MVEITGVTFTEGGKIYYFAPNGEEYEKGTGVIVETARGAEYATVVIPRGNVDEERIVSPLKPVLRVATPRDIEQVRRNSERREEAMRITQEKIAEHGLDMKLIKCDFAFDGSKVTFIYSAPSRVDFRELVKELSSIFKMRIELRQVGIRDEIRLIGGIGPCGRQCCCSTCLPEIKKVSIKMAKTQGLSLNPTKISGMCGRLMCCLAYENETYAEASVHMPKLGAEVGTPDGRGTVVNINMLRLTARVRIEDKEKDSITYHDYEVKELQFRRPRREAQGEEADEEAEQPEEAALQRSAPAAEERPTAEKKQGGRAHGQGGKNKNREKNREKMLKK